MLSVMLTLLSSLPALQAPAAQVPQKLELFAKEEWYKNQKGDEQEFVGVLSRLQRPKGTVGVGRYNEYRLTIDAGGKRDVREVYVGAKPDLLAPYVGKRVSLVGKAVEIEVVGKN